MKRLLLALLLLVWLPVPAQAAGPCQGTPGQVTKVVWVIFENRSLSQVVGHAPYIDSLTTACGYASHYNAITHPSLPNYIALTSGKPLAQLPSTDCPTLCPQSGPSIFAQGPWNVYAESETSPCQKADHRPYVVHHTAAPYYPLPDCSANDLPLTRMNPNALSAFTLIIPNVRNDMHQTSSSVTAGDTWLATTLPPILNSADYQAGHVVVMVTFDEGGKACGCTNTVLTLVLSESVHPGTVVTTPLTHYSLLRTTEELLGYPLLGQAQTAPSMRAGFGL